MSYTIFAMGADGMPVEHLLPGEKGEPSGNGHRIDAVKLSGLIGTLLDLAGVFYIEVRPGSCARQA
jgi:hypothetical protein